MRAVNRPISFVVVSANHGTMIVSRMDYRLVEQNQRGYGVGFQILNTSSHDQPEVDLALTLLSHRRKHFGDGVVAVDCGANIGVHTIEWAHHMHGWGRVLAFEPQERIYYALAGNIAINNCFNATATLAALGSTNQWIRIPQPNYLRPASFGSLEIKPQARPEFIGQKIDYSTEGTVVVEQRSLDSMSLERVDLVKIDVEGMEIEVLQGAEATLVRCKPQLLVEVIKSDSQRIQSQLVTLGYRVFPAGINVLGIHESDPTLGYITIREGSIRVAPTIC
jgi:FkbM family methyltransferase